jgi:hypothetical protein
MRWLSWYTRAKSIDGAVDEFCAGGTPVLEIEPVRDPNPVGFPAVVSTSDHGMYDCCPKAREPTSHNMRARRIERPRGKKTRIDLTRTSVFEYFKDFSIFHERQSDHPSFA